VLQALQPMLKLVKLLLLYLLLPHIFPSLKRTLSQEQILCQCSTG